MSVKKSLIHCRKVISVQFQGSVSKVSLRMRLLKPLKTISNSMDGGEQHILFVAKFLESVNMKLTTLEVKCPKR